eukprot:GHUV01034238.1.p1 GENE.GHUV01034238.1~~GHUV01034238.1.p1  ORF type:complete len:146 (+),score=27.68 GHUV01034238.1:664-1101(+)
MYHIMHRQCAAGSVVVGSQHPATVQATCAVAAVTYSGPPTAYQHCRCDLAAVDYGLRVVQTRISSVSENLLVAGSQQLHAVLAMTIMASTQPVCLLPDHYPSMCAKQRVAYINHCAREAARYCLTADNTGLTLMPLGCVCICSVL